ncbi:MAG: glutathione S-transferase [Myxococcales bacterium]|nr:glutathione S-transferase [Myxococcales bacterium]MCB9706071.1 glutathione S-transferase [Myxococcales bacterium]
MSTPRLITIPFSHFCDKARWALQRRGIAFVEDGHLPLFHFLAVRRAGGNRTVPALALADRLIGDSTEILQWADAQPAPGPRLYPEGVADEALALEEDFDRHLGPATRRWAYGFILPDRGLIREVARHGAPSWQRAGLELGLPLARFVMRKAMRIDDAGVARSRVKIDEVFDRVGERLADGRPYLTGDQLTAADITFAALAAPALYPAEYGVPFPPVERFPAAIQAEVARLRAHPAGAFGLRIYAEDRAEERRPR